MKVRVEPELKHLVWLGVGGAALLTPIAAAPCGAVYLSSWMTSVALSGITSGAAAYGLSKGVHVEREKPAQLARAAKATFRAGERVGRVKEKVRRRKVVEA